MKAEWNPPVVRIIGLLIVTCLACLPAQAQYGGGTPDDPYQIWTPDQLNAIGANPTHWDKHFKLMADIDLSGYSGEQFNIIGRDLSLPFSGSFDGNDHSIRNFAYRSSTTSAVGIFGNVRTKSGGPATVQNVRLVDPNVDAGKAHGVSALIGQLFSGIVSGCRVDGGRVSGFIGVGGLVGCTSPTNMPMERTILHCDASCRVSGDKDVGGIAGGLSATVGVQYCNSSGVITGRENVGGLVGSAEHARISHCETFGRTIGKHATGGVIGLCTGGYDAVTACAALGSVYGEWDTGGLVGWNIHSAIADSYSIARVSGITRTGGFAGANQGSISTCYASGLVEGESQTGGLIGSLNAEPFYPDGTVADSFWDIDTSGQPTSAGGTGKTTAEMQTTSTFLAAGWDFVDETANGTENLWQIIEAFWDYPRLVDWPWPTYGGGTGEPNDPYLIFTAGQIRGIGPGPKHKHVKLMADIDLAHRGLFIGWSSGVFDGNGHTISNFTCTSGGLFRDVDGRDTVIKNLGLIDPTIEAPQAYRRRIHRRRVGLRGGDGERDGGYLVDCGGAGLSQVVVGGVW